MQSLHRKLVFRIYSHLVYIILSRLLTTNDSNISCLISMKTFVTITLCTLSVQAWWTEFELTGVENSIEGIFKSDLKVTRFNKTTYTIHGDIEFTETMDHNYDCEGRSYYIWNGNNQYNLLPYKIPRDNCCTFFDSFYFRLSFEKELALYSNLPKRENGIPLCKTYLKGNYTIKPDPVDKNIIVKYVDPGAYKAEVFLYNRATGKISSTLGILLKLY